MRAISLAKIGHVLFKILKLKMFYCQFKAFSYFIYCLCVLNSAMLLLKRQQKILNLEFRKSDCLYNNNLDFY